MKKRQKAARWTLAIVLGFVILTHVLGLLIDLLIETGLVQTPNINMRGLFLPAAFLSVFFITFGILFLVHYFKKDYERCVLLWHILFGVSLVIIALKFIKPTILTILIPYYFVIFFVLTIALWYVVFLHLRTLHHTKK